MSSFYNSKEQYRLEIKDKLTIDSNQCAFCLKKALTTQPTIKYYWFLKSQIKPINPSFLLSLKSLSVQCC